MTTRNNFSKTPAAQASESPLVPTSLSDLADLVHSSTVKTMQVHDLMNALLLDGLTDKREWDADLHRDLEVELAAYNVRITKVTEPNSYGVRFVRFVSVGTKADALLFAAEHLTPEADALLRMEGAHDEIDTELAQAEANLQIALASLRMAQSLRTKR